MLTIPFSWAKLAEPVQITQFDEWGYDYDNNFFSGRYCYFDRNTTTYCDEYPNDMLVMNWSDEWMTTKCGPDPFTYQPIQRGCDSECNCDGISKGWLAYYVTGYVDGNEYESFTKLEYTPSGECPEGYSVWGEYCILEQTESLGEYFPPKFTAIVHPEGDFPQMTGLFNISIQVLNDRYEPGEVASAYISYINRIGMMNDGILRLYLVDVNGIKHSLDEIHWYVPEDGYITRTLTIPNNALPGKWQYVIIFASQEEGIYIETSDAFYVDRENVRPFVTIVIIGLIISFFAMVVFLLVKSLSKR